MFTKTSQRHFYNGLSGRRAETEICCLAPEKEKSSELGEKYQKLKKEFFLTKAKLTSMICTMNKRWISLQGLVPFLYNFFLYNFLSDESKEWREIQSLNVFCPSCRREVWSVLQVSLQPSSGNSFSFPCTAFLPSKRQTSDAWGLLYCTGKSAAEKSIKLLYLKRRENLFSKLKQKWQTLGNLWLFSVYLVNTSGPFLFFLCRAFCSQVQYAES